MTATNDEAVQRWYHFTWLGYSYASAAPLKLVKWGTEPLTFKMQNVYGHGYTAYWLGYANADGRIRASYTWGDDATPFQFVRVGCNRYKIKNVRSPYQGKFAGGGGLHWWSFRSDEEDADVVTVWGVGEDVDECGEKLDAGKLIAPTTTTTTTIPLQDGNTIKMRLASDPNSPNKWFSMTATNDEAVQRWYHFTWLGYSYASAAPLKLVKWGTEPLTFKMQNVYGHGYTAYWLGYANADGRIRASYTWGDDATPFQFVRVGCNRYKIKNVRSPYQGKFAGGGGLHWWSFRSDEEDADVVSVWGVGEDVDECGEKLDAGKVINDVRLTAESQANPPFTVIVAACAFFGGAVASLLVLGMTIKRRRYAPEIDELLLG